MRVLMCPPTYYKISYEINPYMHKRDQPDSERAHEQWDYLYNILIYLGVEIVALTPLQNAPDMVFTANGGLSIPGRSFIPSHFLFSQRQVEVEAYKSTVYDYDYSNMIFPPLLQYAFEGEGDAIFVSQKPSPILFFGHGIRSSFRNIQKFQKTIGDWIRLVPLALHLPRFYHLDTCFFPYQTAEGDLRAMLIEGAIAPESLAQLSGIIHPSKWTVLPPTDGLICNSIQVGDTVLLNWGGGHGNLSNYARDVRDYASSILSNSAGLKVIDIYTSEFHKAGGGAKCMVLFLKR